MDGKMNNTSAFYKLSLKRRGIEESIKEYDLQIADLREQAKKLPKGSEDRKNLMGNADMIAKSEPYKILKAEMNTMNFCINTVF